MKYPAYESYKDSGIEWLGIVPEHWKLIQIKRLSMVARGASPRPIADQKYFDDEGEYAWVRISDVTASGVYLQETTQKLSELGASCSVKLAPGELFLSIAGSVGKPSITGIKACIHDGFVYFPYLKENRKFLYYLFEGGEAYKGLGKMGTQLNLNTDTVGWIKIGLPTENEQEQIVTFLDRETAVIDTLIAKQEELIRLLGEKRTAVIGTAVTKGLNPHAPMKDSGSEWLGQIPAHWTVSWLKHHVNTVNGFGFNSSDVRDEGVPFIRAGNIKNKTLMPTDLFLPQEVVNEHKRVILISGDIVISMVGSHPKIIDSAVGQLGIVPTSLEGAVPNQNVVILREKNNEELTKRFLFYSLWSTPYRNHLNLFSHQLANQSIISSSLIVSANCLLPPIKEQKEIADYLDYQLEKLDVLISKSEGSIELMKERRTALISAAVTGKIDVRQH